MSTSTRSIDVAPRRLGAAHLALALAVLSLPGSLLPWDWFTGGGLVFGVPLAAAAIVLAVRARRSPAAGSAERGVATGAIVLAVAVLLIPVVWLAVSAAT